ncbi:MAG: GxxExxY protein [Rhizobacter sp.]|nr:GxxExxY protein [Ferruginibacter sp.]
MYTLNEIEDVLCKEIKDCAYRVHKELGPGLPEKIYEACFCHELKKKDIPFKMQVKLPFNYDGLVFDEGLQMDVLVDNIIICELKAIDNVNPIWQAQILSHLKLANLHVGFIINFNSALIKDGMRRYCIQKY